MGHMGDQRRVCDAGTSFFAGRENVRGERRRDGALADLCKRSASGCGALGMGREKARIGGRTSRSKTHVASHIRHARRSRRLASGDEDIDTTRPWRERAGEHARDSRGDARSRARQLPRTLWMMGDDTRAT